MNITQEQATQIHDLESYTTVTGAKRFKRTKAEMDAGYSPEEALKRRLDISRGGVDNTTGEEPNKWTTPRPLKITETSKKSAKSGDIVVRPLKGVSHDYFEHVPGSPIQVTLDDKWYGWFDTLANGPYQGDVNKLIQHILDMGIGEVITKIHFPGDIVEYEK